MKSKKTSKILTAAMIFHSMVQHTSQAALPVEHSGARHLDISQSNDLNLRKASDYLPSIYSSMTPIWREAESKLALGAYRVIVVD